MKPTTRFIGQVRMIAAALCAVICLCGDGWTDTLVWVSRTDSSLRKANISTHADPVLLFGHNVYSFRLVPSPCGRYVATDAIPEGRGVMIYDTWRPGTRRLIQYLPEKLECFVGAWSPSESGVLVSRSERVPAGSNIGVYTALANGHRELWIKTPCAGLPQTGHAAYSPNKELLAIEGDGWLHIVRTGKRETVLFSTDVDNIIGMRGVWLDDDNYVFCGREHLRLVTVSKRTIKPCASYYSISSLVYSQARGQLYAILALSSDASYGLYCVDTATGKLQKASLGGLRDAYKLVGITSDGKVAVVIKYTPTGPTATDEKEQPPGVWAVELDTGKHTLIAEDVLTAVLLPTADGGKGDPDVRTTRRF